MKCERGGVITGAHGAHQKSNFRVAFFYKHRTKPFRGYPGSWGVVGARTFLIRKVSGDPGRRGAKVG